MAKRNIEEARAAFATPPRENNNTEYVNNYYNFWDMKVGQTCTIRFLPDLNEDSPRGFLVEKTTHSLTINGEKKTIACMEPFTGPKSCPICKLSSDYYKVEDKLNGKKYWRKKGYIAQALILEDPLPPNKDTGETHVGKVRYIALGFQLYNIIKEAYAATVEPLEAEPCDIHDGYDFVIKKSQKGEYADYSVGTKFFSKQRALTEDELAVFGETSVDLATLLPKNPGVEKVQAMLNAELNGEQYNDKKDDDNGFSTPAAKAAPAAKIETPAHKAEAPKVPETPAPAPAGNNDVDDMLATIRARRKAAASATPA
jgi:hypothetical protein